MNAKIWVALTVCAVAIALGAVKYAGASAGGDVVLLAGAGGAADAADAAEAAAAETEAGADGMAGTDADAAAEGGSGADAGSTAGTPAAGAADSAAGGEGLGQAPPHADADDAFVFVDVGGAVARPGVIALPQGSRIVNAIEAAGGLTDEADASGLNQATVLADGDKVYVPTAEDVRQGASVPPSVGTGGAAAGGAVTGSASPLSA